MRLTTEHDHAPRFRVTYTIPAYKAAHAAPSRLGEVLDQASKLRQLCRSTHRTAGEFTAWTEAEAIKAAISAGKIPTGALTAHAARLEDPDFGESRLFGN